MIKLPKRIIDTLPTMFIPSNQILQKNDGKVINKLSV